MNLPTSMALSGGNISYIYDATGKKLKKTLSTGTSTIYAGNYVYEGTTGSESLKFFGHPEGYVDAESGYKYVYQYKDHLGNVRLSYQDVSTNSTSVLEILEENNYYPFGLKHKGYNGNINGIDHPYGFGGKEEQNEFNGTLQWLDFGARNYDAALGRWMNLDAVAEVEPSFTPYRYAFNNPLSFIDPDGMYEWRVNTQTGEYEKIGDEGGDETQNIYFNDDKKVSASLKGSRIYTGAVRRNRYNDGKVHFAVSTVDVWEDLPDEYQGAYTIYDLTERYKAKKEGGDKWDLIKSQEEEGLAREDQIWNNRDLKNKVIETMGNDSGLALAAYTGMLSEIVGNLSAPSLPSNGKRATFNPTFKPNKLSNNSWIRYLQLNGGKYKGKYGKEWIKKASEDYQKLKQADK